MISSTKCTERAKSMAARMNFHVFLHQKNSTFLCCLLKPRFDRAASETMF